MVRVVDGDTFLLGSDRIRLAGIDAPEAGQTCKDQWGQLWPCGAAATRALTTLLTGKQVRCAATGRDRYRRTLAECFADGTNINAHMVRQGYAWAFVRYSRSYLAEQAAARRDGIGIWQGEALPAWDYRAQLRAATRAQFDHDPARYNENGPVDRAPPWHTKLVAQLDNGQRWLCSQAEAMLAAWRAIHAP